MLSLTNKFEDIKYYGTETVRNGPRGKRPNLIFNRTFVAMDHFVPEYKYSTIAVPDMVVGDNSQCNVNAIFHLSFVFFPCQWVLYSYLWSAASVFPTHSNNEPQVVDHVLTIQVNGCSSGNWSHQNRRNHALSIPCSSVPRFLPWLAQHFACVVLLFVSQSLLICCFWANYSHLTITSQSPHCTVHDV